MFLELPAVLGGVTVGDLSRWQKMEGGMSDAGIRVEVEGHSIPSWFVVFPQASQMSHLSLQATNSKLLVCYLL